MKDKLARQFFTSLRIRKETIISKSDGNISDLKKSTLQFSFIGAEFKWFNVKTIVQISKRNISKTDTYF